MELFTSLNGRISRSSFWIGLLGIIVISIVCSVMLGMFFSGPLNIISMLVSLALLYPAAAISIKRLHDRNKSAMPWIAVFFLPGLISNLMWIFQIDYSVLDVNAAMGEEMGAMISTMLEGQEILVPGASAILLGFVSLVVGIWALVELGVLKGSNGENDYGPDPTI